MKHGYFEMDLRDLTERDWVHAIGSKIVWANIRVLVDRVPSRGDTMAFTETEYALLKSL